MAQRMIVEHNNVTRQNIVGSYLHESMLPVEMEKEICDVTDGEKVRYNITRYAP